MDHGDPSGFDHLVLTRFSAVRRPGSSPLPEEWLRYRLAFFYDACHASLTRQAAGQAGFRWLVFLDDRCPDAFRHEITDLAAGAFEAVWGHDPFPVELDRVIAATTTAPHLITTRVDSDDAVARDFVAAIQSEFARQDRLYLNFTRGIQIDRSGAVYRRDQRSGPFLSLIEARQPGQAPATVFATKHQRANTVAPLREVRADPMWAQVIHGGNIRNIIAGPRIDPAVVAAHFDLDLGYRRQISLHRLLTEKARHRAWLLGDWLRHPGRFVEALDVAALRLRDTHTVPADPQLKNVAERVRARAIRLGYRSRAGAAGLEQRKRLRGRARP